MTDILTRAPEAKMADSAPSSLDVVEAFDDFMQAFEAFKETNDQRLAEIESRVGADVVTTEKMDRINKALDDLALKSRRLPIGGETPARPSEAKQAFEAEGAAALNSAQVQRKLASERINAVWTAMPVSFQKDLDSLHNAWVKEMKARCATEAAGTDTRSSMRKARELSCQTRLVRSCASTLERNIRSRSTQMHYCRF